MHAPKKYIFNYQVCKAYNRFTHTETKSKRQAEWLKPVGYETNITVYNPITKCKMPLILKNKNYLTWYICGPTVYDSSHIGHAVNYMNSDIIRRILSEHFNINVITAMSITDVDDKIIARSNSLKQSYQELTKHYELEFFEDMKKLNVMKPNICCKVTEYIPHIIEFIKSIIEKGNAYIAEDGSIYFDTERYGMYGKFSNQASDNSSTHKKSATDFCLWKKAKNNEPFWTSPWGNGRPGWHIECSTIASTVFGNSIDIHSGGIDLAFPHHENEEAQSCCYHEVKQWVNYWIHFGHVFLNDVKMSKSLQNTISIQEFLEKYTANHLRILCLLTNYRNGLAYSDEIMQNPVAILNKIEYFIYDCNNYIGGTFVGGNVDEVVLLSCLEETENNINIALANDFNTTEAMKSLLNLIDVTNKMLHKSEGLKTTSSTCIPAVVAVLNYVQTTFSKFGILKSATADDDRMRNIVQCFVKFRDTVRQTILKKEVKDTDLLVACDRVRSKLSSYGVIMQDSKNETSWSIKKY